MDTANYLLDFIARFRVILNTHEGQFKCFDKYAIQVEGWLKGEIAYEFDCEKNAGELDYFAPEVNFDSGRRKVDCKLILRGTPIWIELKHWQIGYQDEERWKASNYFGSKNIGIYNDVDKLRKIKEGDKYLIILATKNPECEEHGDWEKGLDKFNQRFIPLHIKSYLNPADFPPSYFLGLLEVI